MKDDMTNLLLSFLDAMNYLKCGKRELEARQPDFVSQYGVEYWLLETLDGWLEQDDAAERPAARFISRTANAWAAASHNPYENGAATLAGASRLLRLRLGELAVWSNDGRLLPDGEVTLYTGERAYIQMPVWLPDTLTRAKAFLVEWRVQDTAQAAERSERRRAERERRANEHAQPSGSVLTRGVMSRADYRKIRASLSPDAPPDFVHRAEAFRIFSDLEDELVSGKRR